MLLTKLHETISRRAKTVDELQKLIDVSGSTGIEAISSDSVKIVDRMVVLQNIITPGQLPFKFEAASHEISLRVNVPTLRSLHGMEGLVIQDFEIGSVSKSNQYGPNTIYSSRLTTLKGMPKVSGSVKLNNMLELKDLEGLNILEGAKLSLQNCPHIPNLAPAQGVTTIKLMECKNITFQDFPESCKELNIEYLTITRGLPWFITIPPTCQVKIYNANQFLGIELPSELLAKILEYQRTGKSSKVHLLEIQTELIDADLDNLAEL